MRQKIQTKDELKKKNLLYANVLKKDTINATVCVGKPNTLR